MLQLKVHYTHQKVIWRKWTGALLHWWNAASQIGNQVDYKNIGFWSCIASDQKIPFLFIDWKWCSVVPWQLNIFAYRTWGYAEPLGRFAKMCLLFLEWTWRCVETWHWSKGMEREKSDKMCGSNTGWWSISVIMILPDCKKICSPVNLNDGARPMWAE